MRTGTVWAPDAKSKAAADIRTMFAAISPRYDLLNRLISLGQDRRWRRRAARLAELEGSERVLDIATGTGDMALAFARHLDRGRVTGVDFCAPMLEIARRKLARGSRASGRVFLAAADALRLPFRDESFDVVTVAFGVRNFADLASGLREMRRVLRPGGRVVILESSKPERPLQRLLARAYLRAVPAVGRAISRSGTDAYRYLTESMEAFPGLAAFEGLLHSCGFESAKSMPLTMGLVAVTVARRPE